MRARSNDDGLTRVAIHRTKADDDLALPRRWTLSRKFARKVGRTQTTSSNVRITVLWTETIRERRLRSHLARDPVLQRATFEGLCAQRSVRAIPLARDICGRGLDPRVVAALVPVGQEHPDAFIAILGGSGRELGAAVLELVGSLALPALTRAAADPRRAHLVVEPLAKIGSEAAFEPLVQIARLEKGRRGRSNDLRRRAVEGVASLRHPPAFDFLVESLSDGAPALYGPAAQGLAYLQDERAIPVLRGMLFRDEPAARSAGIEWLRAYAGKGHAAMQGAPRDLEMIVRNEPAETDYNAHFAARWLQLYGVEGVDALFRMWTDPNPAIRKRASAGIETPYPLTRVDPRVTALHLELAQDREGGPAVAPWPPPRLLEFALRVAQARSPESGTDRPG
jgi:HEAT repeat protein